MDRENVGYLLFKEAITAYQRNVPLADDFYQRSADLMLKNIDTYRCRPMPTPPNEVQEIHKETMGKRDVKVSDDFWRQGHIWAWLEARNRIVGANRGSYGLLCGLMSKPFLSVIDRERVGKMILEFKSFFEEECKRADYKPYIPPSEMEETEPIETTEEALNIADIFGGEIV